MDTVNLAGKVYMVTGANNGLGKEVTKYLASKGCRVYMVCRSKERAEAARNDILSATNCAPANLRILNADCSLEADVRRAWAEFAAQEQTLDALVCNAGTLTHEKTFTPEGVEVTFAAHLLFGTYLLGSLALPTLERTPDSRVVVVSSGGMYNSAFPAWREATSTGIKAYDGQFAYAYGAWLLFLVLVVVDVFFFLGRCKVSPPCCCCRCWRGTCAVAAKRGQVLLCEQWAKLFPRVKFVSCHPGWTRTEGVEQVRVAVVGGWGLKNA